MAKKITKDMFNAKPIKGKTGAGYAGFDNVRENIDPHIKTGAVTSAEGTIQHTPTNAKDIVNKEYVDGKFPIKLNEIDNPNGNKTFNMTTRQVGFLWTNPSGNPMELEASGAYSGSLMHIHQHTGNPGQTYLLELEASDSDVEHIKSTGAGATTSVLCTWVDPDVEERFSLKSSGALNWGDGTAALDTNMYRSGVGEIKTDGDFYVLGDITIGGTVDGIDIATDVGANTTHRSSDGTDHTYINQDLQTTASPRFTDLKATGFMNIGGTPTKLNISGGTITVTRSCHTVDTEGGAASDALTTITGGVNGDILILSAFNNARTVVVTDGVASIRCAGNFSLNHSKDMIMFQKRGNTWNEISRSDNN